MAKVNVLGIEFDNYSEAEVFATIKSRQSKGQQTFVVTANPEIVMYAGANPDYAALVNAADIVTPDGIGIVKGAQTLGTPLKERVTGFDLLKQCLAYANEAKLRVYLVGAKPAVIAGTVENITRDYPDLVLCGQQDGYFKDDQKVQAAIVAAKPDMTFAALGFPKQEFFLKALAEQMDQGLFMGVGGSFDVLSGTVKRAPKWIQKIHFEWLYRLLKDPSRIGRMMIIPKYLRAVKRQAREKNE